MTKLYCGVWGFRFYKNYSFLKKEKRGAFGIPQPQNEFGFERFCPLRSLWQKVVVIGNLHNKYISKYDRVKLNCKRWTKNSP